MKVKMLKDCEGSNCGKFLKLYEKGMVYELSESLAKNFISMGVAKVEKEAPENKANTHADYQDKMDKPKANKESE